MSQINQSPRSTSRSASLPLARVSTVTPRARGVALARARARERRARRTGGTEREVLSSAFDDAMLRALDA